MVGKPPVILLSDNEDESICKFILPLLNSASVAKTPRLKFCEMLQWLICITELAPSRARPNATTSACCEALLL